MRLRLESTTETLRHGERTETESCHKHPSVVSVISVISVVKPSQTNGFVRFSSPIVVSGPWPDRTRVSSGRL